MQLLQVRISEQIYNGNITRVGSLQPGYTHPFGSITQLPHDFGTLWLRAGVRTTRMRFFMQLAAAKGLQNSLAVP
jgi:hypothetical protein